jgi:hypothetical protein
MAMAAFKIIRLACIVVVLHWGVKGTITDDALESQAGDLGNSKNQDDHGLIALHNAAIRRTLCPWHCRRRLLAQACSWPQR